MRILICGASGFIGRALECSLGAAGHHIVRGLRQPRRAADLSIDFAAPDASEWTRQLRDIDVVINCVGIIVESGTATFASLHQFGPQTLFRACVEAGVHRVIQISALGAADGDTPYFTSKRAADETLMQLPIAWQIVRPSLIYGANGRSATTFRQLASLPLIPLPAGGGQALQPIHIDDLCAAVGILLDPATPAGQCIDLVGPTPLTLKQMLFGLRQAMGFAPAFSLAIPAGVMALTARMLSHLPGSLLTPDTWKMLQAGNTAGAAPLTALLGRIPRAPSDFIAPPQAASTRQEALAAWRNPLLRAALATVWLITAFVCLFTYPVEDSLQLLARTGLTGSTAQVALYGAILLDLGLGWATLFQPGRRLWLVQIALVTAYTGIIAIFLPEYLSHPYGPISKNLPILAVLFILLSEENAS